MSRRARERANARPWEQGEQPEPDDHQHAGDFPERDADAVDAQRYRWLADCNNYEAGLALIIDPKLTEQALDAAIDAAMRKDKP